MPDVARTRAEVRQIQAWKTRPAGLLEIYRRARIPEPFLASPPKVQGRSVDQTDEMAMIPECPGARFILKIWAHNVE